MVKDLTSEKRPVPDPQPDAVPHNLPPQLTSLIGRERETVAVKERLLLPNVRLLTLLGPGGIGKTRLALAAAEHLLDQFPSGVFFVSLAPLRDPALVCSTIAQTLDLREMGAKPAFEMLKDYLRDKTLLLLLDNFEPVVEAAPQLAELLVACPGLKVLVTSREILRLWAEYQFEVPPLGLPETTESLPLEQLTEYEAIGLFIDRARAVRSDFALNDENAGFVTEICRRLDGLPLAIQLAAARVKFLTPQAMLPRLEQRLKVLTGGARDVPERQQTMRDTIAWSYDLLSEPEQKLFRHLSVFAGGCTLEAAEAVCNGEGDLGIEVAEGLESLVGKSLLKVEETGGEPRFLMLETVREFGLEGLMACGEGEAVRARYARYFRRFSRKALADLTGPGHRETGDRLELEHDNFRAVLNWSLRGDDVETGLRLGGSLGEFWQRRGHLTEGRAWLSRLLAAENGAPSVARAGALTTAGTMAYYHGDFSSACTLLELSLSESRGLLNSGVGQREAVKSLVGLALAFLGDTVIEQGNYDLAESYAFESVAMFEELGILWGATSALHVAASVSMFKGDFASARTRWERCLAMDRLAGYRWGEVRDLWSLGLTSLAEGDRESASGLLTKSLIDYWELGEKSTAPAALAVFASLEYGYNRSRRAARLLGAAVGLNEAMGQKPPSLIRRYLEALYITLPAALGKEGFAVALAEGRAMSLDQAVEYALADEPDPEIANSSPAAAVPADPSPLTRREREIAALIAGGLPNREIAAQLVISERTVETHLANIMAKLTFSSRSQVAVWAAKNLA